jgi:hypothetical protein
MTDQELVDLHKKCRKHRAELESSTIAGCFYCCRTFDPATIKEWLCKGQDALCPLCGIDSVLAGVLDTAVLKEMHIRWFSPRKPALS